MQHKKQEIFVVDHSWNGHIPTYHKHICKALLELGFKVQSVSMAPYEVMDELMHSANAKNLEVHFWSKPSAETNNTSPHAELHQPKKAKTSVGVKQQMFNLLYKHPTVKKIFDVHERWRKMEQRILEIMPNAINRDDVFVLVPYIENWLLAPYYPQFLFKRAFRLNWSGLYLHPNAFRTGVGNGVAMMNIFKAPSCHSLALLDEGLIDKMQGIIKKPVVHFPDITNVELDIDRLSDVAKEIKARSAGRKIISLLGVINNKKNLPLLLDAIKLSSERNLPYYFVIAGESNKYMWNDEQEFLAIVNTIDKNSGNTFSYLHKLNDGQDYNSIVYISDVLLASYKNFYHSSNTLTKAAYFHKPVIVGAGYLMQERVERYKTGQAIDGADAENILSAIKNLAEENNAEREYNNYYAMHTYERLKEALSEMIV